MKRFLFAITAFACGFAAHSMIFFSEAAEHCPIHNNATPRKKNPICSVMIERDGYALSYDTRTRNAKWVYEELTAKKLAGNVKRNNFSFKEDLLIPNSSLTTEPA